MAKLHELVAVTPNLATQTESARKDLMNTFEKKEQHFIARRVIFKPLEEGVPEKTEDQLDIQTTVAKELAWITGIWSKSLDASFQISIGNQQSRQDIVLEDGTVLAKDVPVSNLLELEDRIVHIREFVKSIKTLDPAKGFVLDPTQGEGIYKAREIIRDRSKKVNETVILHPPTDKHPAQVIRETKDVPIGQLTTFEWSSLITTSEKGQMFDRVEELLRAVKKARARANELEVDTKTNRIGSKLLNFVFTGLR